jgi:TPR repeat protein
MSYQSAMRLSYRRSPVVMAGTPLARVLASPAMADRRESRRHDGLVSVSHPWLNRVLAGLGSPAAQCARAEALADRESHALSVALFARAAGAGLARAQYRLGRCYLLGLGVPPSTPEGLRWMRRAGEAGDTAAQTQLAALAMQGVSDRDLGSLFAAAGAEPGEPDFERAEYWCRLAAASGSAEAKGLLASILTGGPEEMRDAAAGEALYRESAEAGLARGRIGLAMILLQDGSCAGATQARELLLAAAADGVAIAHHLSGMMAESGAGGPVDPAAAAASYKVAAEMGHAPAQVRYGFALLHGRGTERDPFQAETWLRRAALAGEASAAATLGYLYAQDGEFPPNYAEAVVWLRRAAEAGHSGAARILGNFYLAGVGVHQDLAEAADWLRRAADTGDEPSRADLLHLALTRRVSLDDQIAAATSLRKAAEAGDAAAQFNFGLCLAQGIGAAQDGDSALVWVHKAAAGGNPLAIRLLAALPEAACGSTQPRNSA